MRVLENENGWRGFKINNILILVTVLKFMKVCSRMLINQEKKQYDEARHTYYRPETQAQLGTACIKNQPINRSYPMVWVTWIYNSIFQDHSRLISITIMHFFSRRNCSALTLHKCMHKQIQDIRYGHFYFNFLQTVGKHVCYSTFGYSTSFMNLQKQFTCLGNRRILSTKYWYDSRSPVTISPTAGMTEKE